MPGLGEATFVQAAGFLKIPGGDNPLDATWIHPESYPVANRALERLAATPPICGTRRRPSALGERIAGSIRSRWQGARGGPADAPGHPRQLARPGRDPREDLPPPVFKRGIIKLEDLSPNMELTGTVLNVVDFGCFVDIGMHESGLVHVSRLADKFVHDPHDVVAVGDIVKVWVMAVDKQRRRVSLTSCAGSERPGRRATANRAAANHAMPSPATGSHAMASHAAAGSAAASAGGPGEGQPTMRRRRRSRLRFRAPPRDGAARPPRPPRPAGAAPARARRTADGARRRIAVRTPAIARRRSRGRRFP